MGPLGFIVTTGILAGCGRIGFGSLDPAPLDDAALDDAPSTPGPGRLRLPPGDVTGDTISDLLVYSSGASLGTPGALWVFAGAPIFSPSVPTQRIAVIVGTAACAIRDTFRLIDLDGDQHAEILVGADCAGERRIAIVRAPVGQVAVDAYPMLAISGAVTLAGFGEPGMPSAVFGSGDLDGDGRRDLIGLYHWQEQVQIYSNLVGLSGDLVATTTINGASGGALGSPAEAIAADLTGDGRDDLVVAEHHADVPLFDSGAVYVLAGPLPAGTHDVTTLPGTTITGDQAASEYGRVAVLDMNLDGGLDLVVASPYDVGGRGRVAIFFGPLAPGVRLSTSADVIVDGSASDAWGTWLDGHADLDGDGNPDLVFTGADSVVGLVARATLVSGARPTPEMIVDTTGITLTDAVAIGDVDADGADEVIISTSTNGGIVYILAGRVRSGTLAAQALSTIQGTSGEGFGLKLVQR